MSKSSSNSNCAKLMFLLLAITMSTSHTIALTTTASSSSSSSVPARIRIVNGTVVSPENKYPYLAYVTKQNFVDGYLFRCAGTLVAPDVILTAAHCNLEQEDETFAIFMGEFDVTNPFDQEPAYSVVEVAIHPYFDYATQNYDFMLLRLDREAKGYPFMSLDDGSYGNTLKTLMGEDLTVMGWGAINEEGNTTDVLRETTVQAYDTDTCVRQYGDLVREAVLCALASYTDSCQGDSGGPLIFKSNKDGDVQIGIVSKGAGCARPDVPGVYANVGTAYNMIGAQLCAWNSTSTFCGVYPPSTPKFAPAPAPTIELPDYLTQTPAPVSLGSRTNCWRWANSVVFVFLTGMAAIVL